jgi:hypothetical protein
MADLMELIQRARILPGGGRLSDLDQGLGALRGLGDKLEAWKQESRATHDDGAFEQFLKGVLADAYNLNVPQSKVDLALEATPIDELGALGALALKGPGKKLSKALEGFKHGAQGSIEENFREAAGTLFYRVDRAGKATPIPKGVDAKATRSDAVVQVNADNSRTVIDGDVMSFQQEQAINALEPGEVRDLGESVVHELVDEPLDETAAFLAELGVESGEGAEKLKALINPGTAKPGGIKAKLKPFQGRSEGGVTVFTTDAAGNPIPAPHGAPDAVDRLADIDNELYARFGDEGAGFKKQIIEGVMGGKSFDEALEEIYRIVLDK